MILCIPFISIIHYIFLVKSESASCLWHLRLGTQGCHFDSTCKNTSYCKELELQNEMKISVSYDDIESNH